MSAAAAAVLERASVAAIETRAVFDFVRYGSVWEDADVLCDALARWRAGDGCSRSPRPATTRSRS